MLVVSGAPCGIPALVPGGLQVPLVLAAALMPFACKDPTRTHLSGLGFEDGHVCATDGLSGVRVLGLDPGGGRPKDHDAVWWHGDVVRDAIARSREAKSATIFLAWSECDASGRKYAPLSQVIPNLNQHGKPSGEVGLDGTILGRLQKLCEAVQGRRQKDCTVHSVAFAFGAPLDPVLLTIEGRRGAPSIQVVIMPVRL